MNPTTPAFRFWLAAARLRTLPLAFACIFLGNFLAAADGHFNTGILLLSLLTTLFFQVLSNFANDYGDGVKGTDKNRLGEKRMVNSGHISEGQMKKAVYLFGLLSFLSSSALSYLALIGLGWSYVLLFMALGCLAILAAIFYTVGNKAYGYSGFGDLFVLVFFGWVGVVGSYYIQTHNLNPAIWMPATAVGMLSVGVLNLNNMRDIESDKRAGKQSIPVRIGPAWAKAYHIALMIAAFDLAFFYVAMRGGNTWRHLYLSALPFLLLHLNSVFKANHAQQFDPMLKKLALTTLWFCLSLGLGVYLSQ